MQIISSSSGLEITHLDAAVLADLPQLRHRLRPDRDPGFEVTP
jgi:hypothetical protein